MRANFFENDARRIAILMAVYNGERFLPAQLTSIEQQTVGQIDVLASDDGSSDRSRAILLTSAANWQKGSFEIVDGPRAGFAENFRSMLTNPAMDADYIAFSDQDDIWDSDKLETAVSWLARQDRNRPALYCSRTRSITIDGEEIGKSPLFTKPPTFRNAIVQSLAGANTMVLNRSAFELVREASRRTSFVSHDWWCYLVVSGAGGVVWYDPKAHIGYRQHNANLVGENNSWRARISRIGHLIGGRFIGWNNRNLDGLEACADLLDNEARATVNRFRTLRSAPLFQRVYLLRQARLYRQTVAGQIGLYAACLFRRL